MPGDVEVFIDPALRRIVPPGVLVHQEHAPTLQRCRFPRSAIFARSAGHPRRPISRTARNGPRGVGEVAPTLRELDQADGTSSSSDGRRLPGAGPNDRRRTIAALSRRSSLSSKTALPSGRRERGRSARHLKLARFNVLPPRVLRQCCSPRPGSMPVDWCPHHPGPLPLAPQNTLARPAPLGQRSRVSSRRAKN